MKTLILLLVLVPAVASGMELCSMMGGICQDACRQDQYAETGAFEDCSGDQECCVQNTRSGEEVQEPAQVPIQEDAVGETSPGEELPADESDRDEPSGSPEEDSSR